MKVSGVDLSSRDRVSGKPTGSFVDETFVLPVAEARRKYRDLGRRLQSGCPTSIDFRFVDELGCPGSGATTDLGKGVLTVSNYGR